MQIHKHQTAKCPRSAELCERMNCRNPEQLNITYQKFEDDDLEYSDEIFMQLYTSAKNDFEYSPMCKTAQAQIYAMLLDMTSKGSPAQTLISNIKSEQGAWAWHYLNKEFAQRRPTEKLALITSYRKPPRQAPGQSVTSYCYSKRFSVHGTS